MNNNNFYYFPILKTRPSEIRAFTELDNEIKDLILPVIEMTGARGYTYPQNHKTSPGVKREGDINKQRIKVLEMVGENRPFILDITDDISLRYDGLSKIENHNNGYQAWIDFLTADEIFKSVVIPTIQFDTDYLDDTMEQIKKLNEKFPLMAIKLPAFIFADDDAANTDIFNIKNIVANTDIQSIIDFLTKYIDDNKLIVILDFGYIKELVNYQNIISECITSIANTKKINSLILTSSSFPSFVKPIEENSLIVQEQKVFNFCKTRLKDAKLFYSDYASLHPVKYMTSGGGWIPRIDFITSNNNELEYSYLRAVSDFKNDSSEYVRLANRVLSHPKYAPVTEVICWGDEQIKQKADGGRAGNSPSHWISVRANSYMTKTLLELKSKSVPAFSLPQ